MLCSNIGVYFFALCALPAAITASVEDEVTKSLKDIANGKMARSSEVGTTVKSDQVTFVLYTKDNKQGSTVSKTDVSSIRKRQTYFLTHGYTDYINLTWIQEAKDILLKKGDYNVFAVDWRVPAFLDYATSSRNTQPVGHMIGQYIAKLVKERNFSLKDFHLIGHSLGAHVCGFAGKKVRELTGSKVRWITGLDAAGPLFEFPVKLPKNERLSDEDAEIVECLHTDGGVYGCLRPLGTIDFFANGGIPIQPNCTGFHPDTSLKQIQQDLSCSHQKATFIYNYALKKDGVPAWKCPNYVSFKANNCKSNDKKQLAGDLKASDRGSYYFDIVV